MPRALAPAVLLPTRPTRRGVTRRRRARARLAALAAALALAWSLMP